MRTHRITGLVLMLALALTPLGLAQKKPAKKADNKKPAAAEPMASTMKPAGIPPIKLSDTKLGNGLRVIIAEDHSAPVFGIAVTYNVGSRNPDAPASPISSST